MQVQIAAYHADSQDSPFQLIVSNSLLAIVAGADTTATVLRNTVYYLLTNPAYYAQLREEVDAAFPPTETNTLNTEVLSSLPILNAVMYMLRPTVPRKDTDVLGRTYQK